MNENCVFSTNISTARNYPENYKLLKKHLRSCRSCQDQLEKLQVEDLEWKKKIPKINPGEGTTNSAIREIHDLVHTLLRKEGEVNKKSLRNQIRDFYSKLRLSFNR